MENELAGGIEVFKTRREENGMSHWFYLNAHTLTHSSGMTIELRQGSWKAPYGIDTRCAAELSGHESARIIKDGLAYARRNPYALAAKEHAEIEPA